MTGIDAGTVFRPGRSMWFSRMLKVAGDKAEDYRSMHDIRYRVMGRCRWANRGSLASCALRTMRGGSSNTAQLIPDPERLQKKAPDKVGASSAERY